MYAIFRSGGKQYRVKKNHIVRLEKLKILQQQKIEFNEVLMIADEKNIKIGTPVLLGAKIVACVEKTCKFF